MNAADLSPEVYEWYLAKLKRADRYRAMIAELVAKGILDRSFLVENKSGNTQARAIAELQRVYEAGTWARSKKHLAELKRGL